MAGDADAALAEHVWPAEAERLRLDVGVARGDASAIGGARSDRQGPWRAGATRTVEA